VRIWTSKSAKQSGRAERVAEQNKAKKGSGSDADDHGVVQPRKDHFLSMTFQVSFTASTGKIGLYAKLDW
jgi:hypothetical protein